MDGGPGNASVPGQGTDAPMAGAGWRTLQCRVAHFGYPLFIMGAGSARRLLVIESCDAVVMEATAPFAHRYVAEAQSLVNQQVGRSFSTGQNDLSTPPSAVGQCAGAGHGLQFLLLFLTELDGNWGAANMGMGRLLLWVGCSPILFDLPTGRDTSK